MGARVVEPDELVGESHRLDVAKVHEAMEALLTEARRRTKDLEVPTNLQMRTAVVLLATVLQMARSTSASIGRGDGVEAAIFLRSLMEAFVDLTILVEDPQHIERMETAVLAQRRRILTAATQTGVPTMYLASLGSHPDATDELERVKEEIRVRRARGVVALNVRQRFARAGCLEFYEGPYSLLCDQSHNGLNAIMERHVRATADGPEFFLVGPTSDSDISMIASTAATLAARAVLYVKRLVDGPELHELDELGDTLAAVRTALHGDPDDS